MLGIAAESLTKDFGRVRAVDDVSLAIQPGRVVGLLGPNGSGKTTMLRMLLGLVTPSAGRATIGGRAFAELDDPAHQVGVVLEAAAFHGGRTARDHLRVLAVEAGNYEDVRAVKLLCAAIARAPHSRSHLIDTLRVHLALSRARLVSSTLR